MNVTYSDKIKQGSEGFALLEHATNYLGEEIGSSAAHAQALWDRTTDDQGRPLYTLRISDGKEAASATFALDELKQDGPPMRFRLLRLWGNLLQDRLNKWRNGLEKSNGSGD